MIKPETQQALFFGVNQFPASNDEALSRFNCLIFYLIFCRGLAINLIFITHNNIINMRNLKLFFLACCVYGNMSFAQDDPARHPDTSGAGWVNMFKSDLSNAIFKKGVWKDSAGVFTASADEALWSERIYNNFILDLEFKTAEGTNSGVIVHASNIEEWIPHSVEIQIADDYSAEWSKAPPTWQCAAVFGHQAATKRTVKHPGEWNHYTITCIDRKIWVVLNDELVNTFDMSLYTSAKKNPDGSDIPAWLSNPLSEIPLNGHIGFQGKHAGAPIYFRNIKIKELK